MGLWYDELASSDTNHDHHHEPNGAQPFALQFEDGKSPAELAVPDAVHLLSAKTRVWIHLSGDDKELSESVLIEKLGLNQEQVLRLFRTGADVTLEEARDRVVFAIRSVHLVTQIESIATLAVFFSENWLVTVATKRCEPVHVVHDRLIKDDVPADLPTVLYMLLNETACEYYPALDRLQVEIDKLEDDVFEHNATQSPAVRRAMKLKRRVTRLRRSLWPLRDSLSVLLRRDVALVPADTKLLLQDVMDQVLRLGESAEISHDILSDILDAQVNITSNNLSVVMRILTVISTVLMSMGFVASIYGMNFLNMPGQHLQFGFYLVLLAMGFVGALAMAVFRRFNWI